MEGHCTGGIYPASWGESAVDIEEAYSVFDRAGFQRRVDACCFRGHGGEGVWKVLGVLIEHSIGFGHSMAGCLKQSTLCVEALELLKVFVERLRCRGNFWRDPFSTFSLYMYFVGKWGFLLLGSEAISSDYSIMDI